MVHLVSTSERDEECAARRSSSNSPGNRDGDCEKRDQKAALTGGKIDSAFAM